MVALMSFHMGAHMGSHKINRNRNRNRNRVFNKEKEEKMNKVFLIGNLTKDPEVRYTVSDNPTCVCKFTLAVNDGYGEQQKTSFINIVVFGKSGENCERFLSRGSKVAIEGRIQTGSYEKDGRKVYTTDVVTNSIEFLGNAQDSRLP